VPARARRHGSWPSGGSRGTGSRRGRTLRRQPPIDENDSPVRRSRKDGLEKLARPLLCKWLARAQRKADLRDNGGLHIRRHTFCSHLALQGVLGNAIKELAGHQDIMTTMRYMHLSPAAKELAVQALDNREAALKKERAQLFRDRIRERAWRHFRDGRENGRDRGQARERVEGNWRGVRDSNGTTTFPLNQTRRALSP
jgi:hypothetical protein